MAPNDDLTKRPQNNKTDVAKHSIVTKRKKRVQFLEEGDGDVDQHNETPIEIQDTKRAKFPPEKYHRKEFLESVLFNSGESSDTDDNEPIVISAPPVKEPQRQNDTSPVIVVPSKDDTTVDNYTRNILDRVDFSDSDDMEDFIDEDESETSAKRGRELPSTMKKVKKTLPSSKVNRTHSNKDRSFQLAVDVFGEDYINNISREQNEEEYVSDDSERLFGDEESIQGNRYDNSQSVCNRQNVVQKSIHELFEPDELRRRFLTNTDDIIRNKDVPERFQLRSNVVRPADDDELEREAKWIYDNFIGTSSLLLTIDKRESPNSIVESSKKIAPYDHIQYIKTTLELIRNELCEVPFIHMYRHENINGMFSEDELWTIYKADNKWCSFFNNVTEFGEYLKRFQNYQMSPNCNDIKFSYLISENDFRYLDEINSEFEFFHFYKKIQFYNASHKNDFLTYDTANKIQSNNNSSTTTDNSNGTDMAPTPQREPRSFNRHYFYVSKEIDKIVECFGLTSTQFNENVQMEYQRHNAVCSLESPMDVAENYVSSVFENAEKVIEAAVDMYTLELSHEQHILLYIHQQFIKHARLNVSPTKSGIEQIDESHPYSSFKYIANKPVKGITSEMMIKLDQAKIEKLLNVSISLPEHIISEMMDYLKSFQNCDPNDVSQYSKKWSDLRGRAIVNAVTDHCLPAIEKDIHQQLLREAQQDLIKRCGNVFKNHLIHSPFATELKEIQAATNSADKINDELPFILVISAPPFNHQSNYNTKRNPKQFHMNAVKGRINHPSFKTNRSYNQSYGDNPDEQSSNNANNSENTENSIVGLSRDEIGYAVVLDEFGECVDYVTINNAILQPNNSFNNNNSKMKFVELSFGKIEKMLVKYRIGAVFLPLIDRQYNYLATNLQNRIKTMANKTEFNLPPPNVHLVNPYVSDRLVKVLRRQDPDCAKKIEYLRAISIGRYALDPLVECANLFVNDSESLTFLNDLLPPYQKLLDVDKVRAILEEKLVSIVNEIGVDLNKACSVPWYSNLLQFVCGLGARKAHRLLGDVRSFSESNRLNNRTQLVTVCNLGPKIFINCAGFLKIEGFTEEGDVNLLDATRIHPELYDWTRKIMIDALDIEDPNNLDSSISTKKHNFNNMLTNLRNNPFKLKELDLDVFADELMRQGIPLNKKYSLELITTEMLKEFPDYRPRYSPYTEVEKFWILANGGSRIDLCETLEYSTLSSKYPPSELSRFHNEDLIPVYVGKYVSFVATRFICRRPDQEEISKAVPEKDMDTQRWKCPFCYEHISTDLKLCWEHIENVCPGNAVAVSGVLEGHYGTITGVINLNHVSDNPPKNIKERVRKTMQITCAVMSIKFDRLSVDLTCRTSDLCDKTNNCLKFKRDAYYDLKAEQQQRELKKEQKEKLKKQVIYQKKVIIHPSFKNITFTEAEKLLESAPMGDCIIRPSSKGSDHLTVTWKVYDGIYHHIDIIEKDKPNAFSIGKKLWIKGECYDDLDEIIARYIEPMSALIKEATTLKVFNYAEGGSRHKMATILSEEKKTSPLRIPYVFSPSKIYPGKLLLGFLPRNTPLFEYVSVVPEGVKFRDIIHQSFDDLIKWFKINFNQSTLNSGYPNSGLTSSIAGGSIINKTPNAYQSTKKSSSNITDGSVSPLSAGVSNKLIFKNLPISTSTMTTSLQSSNIPSYTPSSSGLSKKSLPY